MLTPRQGSLYQLTAPFPLVEPLPSGRTQQKKGISLCGRLRLDAGSHIRKPWLVSTFLSGLPGSHGILLADGRDKNLDSKKKKKKVVNEFKISVGINNQNSSY